MTPSERDQLIQRWLDGSLSADEFAALEKELARDPAARQALRQAANLETFLRERAQVESTAAIWLKERRGVAPMADVLSRWRWRLPLGLAAAAALVVAAYQLGGYRQAGEMRPAAPPAEQTARGVAVLTQLAGVRWGAGASPIRVGDTVAPGRIALSEGIAQIEFFSGAVLVVGAPAEFEVVSPWEVKWHHGKVRVKVPPAARGFAVQTPEMKLVDLGTEFGVEVDPALASARVQVFSGEVEAHPAKGAQVNLVEGQAVEQRDGTLAALGAAQGWEFPTGEELRLRDSARAERHFQRWRAFWDTRRQDPRLIAFYSFQPEAAGERLVRNQAQPTAALRDGGAVGATWTSGRWPEKRALEFKHAGDRVRLHLDGAYDAVTFACWVKIDGLDRKFNSLLLTDGYEDGEPHWQIRDDGRLMFGIMYGKPGERRGTTNQLYYSRPVFDASSTGRWHHVAVTYESSTGETVHFFDGNEVGRATSEHHQPGRTIVFGACELGNWGLPELKDWNLPSHRSIFPVRNLNGRIDEFAIYRVALAPAEIREIFEAGRPE